MGIIEKAEFEVELKKLLVLLPILGGFWFGCVIGSYLELAFHYYALLIPAAFTGIVGFVYMFFRQHLKEKLKNRSPTKDLRDDVLKNTDMARGVSDSTCEGSEI